MSRVRGARGSCPCRASDTVPESSPLWDVDCFSLSDRPQVRWRERRRCDYRSSVPEVLAEKRAVDDERQTVQLVTVDPVDGGRDNRTRILVTSNDSAGKKNCYQTQC